MTDWFLLLLAGSGLPILFLTTLLSCLALPVPASIVMLAAGAFTASGELPVIGAALAAFAGAVLGDQVGYLIGRAGENRLAGFLERRPRRAALLARGVAFLRRRGGPGVFFSRWLVSPLGPYVNFAAGAAALRWPVFSAWSVAGEALWVGLYVGLGLGFSANLAAASEIVGDINGVLAGLAVMAVTGWWLLHALREHRRRASAKG